MMHSTALSSRVAILLGVALLGACSLAPDYKRPDPEIPQAYKEVAGWTMAQPADDAPRGPWWEMFADPQLNALEVKAGADNQNLKVALAQYDEARADARAARADFFPSITGNASATRERDSKNVARVAPATLYNDYLVGASATYEIDLWGRVRNEVAAAGARAKASAADLAGIDLSLHAELANDYFSLRADDRAQIVLDETVTAYQKALDLTRDRFKGGVASEVDVDQAETQYQNTKTQAADMHLKRAQLEHAIAVLVGQTPATFSLAPTTLIDNTPVIHPDIPSTLLERRPDIAAAERRAKAANADIGIARAAWFPTFSLSAMFGFESATSSNWFSMPSHFWTLGPSAMGPIFDGGRIAALTDRAHAAYDEAAANYKDTVLNAYKEVEDNLVALHQLQDENQSQTAATMAAERALKREQDRYNGGLITYLDVVVSQNTALQAELSSIDVWSRQMQANVQLVKALGGGWQAGAPDKTHPIALQTATTPAVPQPAKATSAAATPKK